MKRDVPTLHSNVIPLGSFYPLSKNGYPTVCVYYRGKNLLNNACKVLLSVTRMDLISVALELENLNIRHTKNFKKDY